MSADTLALRSDSADVPAYLELHCPHVTYTPKGRKFDLYLPILAVGESKGTEITQTPSLKVAEYILEVGVPVNHNLQSVEHSRIRVSKQYSVAPDQPVH